jgi:hypothetical protein
MGAREQGPLTFHGRLADVDVSRAGEREFRELLAAAGLELLSVSSALPPFEYLEAAVA